MPQGLRRFLRAEQNPKNKAKSKPQETQSKKPKNESWLPTIRNLANASVQEANTGLIETYTNLEQSINLNNPVIEGNITRFTHDASKYDSYWYHSDHLGNSSYISDQNGIVTQHMEYLPFGETLVDEHQNSYNTPYKFNAKERDQETGNYYYGARYYDPKWSIWLSVDPLAERGPQYSPYVFTFNNPIVYTDPDGRWPYPVTFRSFHPSQSFGRGNWFTGLFSLYTPYSGDGRGFSLSDNVTSRITHRVVADPQKGTVTYTGRGADGTISDESHHKYLGADIDNPDGYIGRVRTGDNSVSFETGYEGTNPLAPGPTPDIDVDARLSLVQDGDILNITGQVAGDDFPNTEGFITDPSGQKLFIGADVRASGEDQNPTILFGPATEQIMNINMQVRTNPENGNFIGVMRNGEWVKPDEWNNTFLNQNPNSQN